MKDRNKSLWQVLALIVAVGLLSAYAAKDRIVAAQRIVPPPVRTGPVSVQGELVQDKVLHGSDGRAVMALTLSAAEVAPVDPRPVRHVDLVVVLDRSGSMKGQKITDARNAVVRLIDRLTPNDRLALVSYSNGVQTHLPLVSMDDAHRMKAKAAVEGIHSGGGTNLGGGLDQGIQTLMQTPGDDRHRKVILISDGLANQGVTDPHRLAGMASGAGEHYFSVSTLGVGYDFNEELMTLLADHGAGRYYFLENPADFIQVFEKAFESTRNIAASAVELRLPLKDGVQLIHAGGYPIAVQGGEAVIHPGNLLSGQQRKLFLTFRVPTGKVRNFDLGAFHVKYRADGTVYENAGRQALRLACVEDARAVVASIDQGAWEEQVVREDYNQLKEEVARAIRSGRKDDAMLRIQAYETRNRAVNATVGSNKVSANLDQDVQQLRQSVAETFAGSPAAVAEKKKQRSKALQYESYQIRRDKK